MDEFIKWIKYNWTNPIWSKVFVSIIILVLGLVIIILKSFLEKITFDKALAGSIDYLFNTRFHINLLTLIIIIIAGLLMYLLPFIIKIIINIQINLNSVAITGLSKTNYMHYISGYWLNTYSSKSYIGSETLRINKEGYYFINETKVFILKDIKFNEDDKTIEWTKYSVLNHKTRSIEKLSLKKYNFMEGLDDLGFTVIYKRLK